MSSAMHGGSQQAANHVECFGMYYLDAVVLLGCEVDTTNLKEFV